MKIIPLKNNVLVRLCDVPDKETKIKIPENLQREPYGVVILCGPDCEKLKVGDKILFLMQNAIGHDQYGDPRLILPETVAYALCEPEQTQEGVE